MVVVREPKAAVKPISAALKHPDVIGRCKTIGDECQIAGDDDRGARGNANVGDGAI